LHYDNAEQLRRQRKPKAHEGNSCCESGMCDRKTCPGCPSTAVKSRTGISQTKVLQTVQSSARAAPGKELLFTAKRSLPSLQDECRLLLG
jgi:hypothetical protein